MMFSLRSETELTGFLELARTQAESGHRTEWHLALEEKDTPGCIGGVALMMDMESGTSAELGYWLKQSAWGKGYATEASRFMLDLDLPHLDCIASMANAMCKTRLLPM